MKVTARQIYVAGRVLQQAPKMNPIASFRLRQVLDEYYKVDKERVAIAKSFCGENETVVPPDKMGEFNTEFEKLLDEEVNLGTFKKVELSMLKGTDFSVLEMDALYPFITE